MLRLLFIISLILASYVTLVLWPHENTLALAVEGKISFGAAWGYRLRDATLLLNERYYPFALQILRPAGAHLTCLLLVLLHLPGLMRRSPRALRILPFFASITSLVLLATLANPAGLVHRQRVLGGASFLDEIRALSSRDKIPLSESCIAAVNPHDLRGVSALELSDLKSMRALQKILVVDLKIVEENYRLLKLKNANGTPLFSDAARAFASAEIALANRIMPELITTEKLCLIANFDTLPHAEAAPYSRARKIFDARKKAGRDTRIIQLPGRN
jgi:hypothetical protein